MKNKLAFHKIHHLTRYFLLLAILVFVAFIRRWNEAIALVFIGPVLYLASGLKKFMGSYFPVPSSAAFHHYALLLPLTLLYYGLIAFQLKQLWNERGVVKIATLAALLGFLVYIHFTTWKHLLGYFQPLA